MIKKILVPLDGSQLAENALPYAEEMARKFEAQLVLIQVLQPKVMMAEFEPGFFNDAIKQEHDSAKIYLHNLKDRIGFFHIPVEVEVLDGGAVADTIIDYANETETDLIVMNTHGRSGFSRWVYGSVANKVLQHAHCPVFLVRAGPTETL